MRTTSFTKKVIPMLLAFLLLASCNKNSTMGEHIVAYFIDNGQEQRAILDSDAEFDELLEFFCDYAQQGSSVTFFNANRSEENMATKDVLTYSTTDRAAIKYWMKKMEDEGMTVTVTYDPNTGTWHGSAYDSLRLPNWTDQFPDICFGDSVWLDTSTYYGHVALCCVPLTDSSFYCYAFYDEGYGTLNNVYFQNGWTYDYYYCEDGSDSLRLINNGIHASIIHNLGDTPHICIT